MGEDELIRRGDVLAILYAAKDDEGIPKNYGTLMDIICRVRAMPSVSAGHCRNGSKSGEAGGN